MDNNISKDHMELKDMIRDYTLTERQMIEEYMAGKKLVKIKGEAHAYVYK